MSTLEIPYSAFIKNKVFPQICAHCGINTTSTRAFKWQPVVVTEASNNSKVQVHAFGTTWLDIPICSRCNARHSRFGAALKMLILGSTLLLLLSILSGPAFLGQHPWFAVAAAALQDKISFLQTLMIILIMSCSCLLIMSVQIYAGPYKKGFIAIDYKPLCPSRSGVINWERDTVFIINVRSEEFINKYKDLLTSSEPNMDDLGAIRRYLSYRARQWWSSQPADRTTAICDVCNDDVQREDGYLVGLWLYCKKCGEEKTSADMLKVIQKNPDFYGEGVLEMARKMFGGLPVQTTRGEA